MKKYAAFMTSLVVFGMALHTPVFAQTDDASGTSGTSGTSANENSLIRSQTESTTQSGAAISDPSGAQAGQQVGVITIQGQVKSETEKQAIESQLKQLPGVTSVNNMLQVADQGAISDPSGAQSDPSGLGTPDDSGTGAQPDSSQPDSGASSPDSGTGTTP